MSGCNRQLFWGTLFWVTVMLVANYISLVNNRFKAGVGSRVDISAKIDFVERNFSLFRRLPDLSDFADFRLIEQFADPDQKIPILPIRNFHPGWIILRSRI